MARLIILVAIIAIGLIVWHKLKKTTGEKRKKLIFMSAIGAVVAVLALLAITGHLNIITAAIAGLVAFLPRVMSLAKYFPSINKLYQQSRGQTEQSQHRQTVRNQQMSIDEALQVLGLEKGCDKQAIVQAHRRMMQKVHPDHGGSDYLAAQINGAKKILLENIA